MIYIVLLFVVLEKSHQIVKVGSVSGDIFSADPPLKYRVFIRKAYQIIIQNSRSSKITFFIIGNPGTGKTFFEIYLFHILVEEGRAVEYNNDDVHLFNQHCPDVCIYDFMSYDSVKMKFASSPINIVLFSPGKSRAVTKKFRPLPTPKHAIGKCELNMLIWKETELKEAAVLLGFPVKEVDEIMKRYELFGGIAWCCFCKGSR